MLKIETILHCKIAYSEAKLYKCTPTTFLLWSSSMTSAIYVSKYLKHRNSFALWKCIQGSQTLQMHAHDYSQWCLQLIVSVRTINIEEMTTIADGTLRVVPCAKLLRKKYALYSRPKCMKLVYLYWSSNFAMNIIPNYLNCMYLIYYFYTQSF